MAAKPATHEFFPSLARQDVHTTARTQPDERFPDLDRSGRQPRYVDRRRLTLGALESGGGAFKLLVVDSLRLHLDAMQAARSRHRNRPWGAIARHLELIRGWIDDGLSVERMQELLLHRGIEVPDRVLRQYASSYSAMKSPQLGSQLGSQPVSQLGSQPVSQLGSQPGSQLGSQLGSHTESSSGRPVRSLHLVPECKAVLSA